MLIVYMIASAFVLGYVLRGQVGRLSAAFLLALFILALALIIDINRPTGRTNIENQRPLEELQATLKARPPSAIDRWRAPQDSKVARPALRSPQ